MLPPRSMFLLIMVAMAAPVVADDVDQKDRLLPFFDDWFVAQGIALPRPLGVGAALIFMDRDVEVDDVRVSFGDRPPESISDRSDFNVGNSTGLITARADAWLLPFLNVYGMVGYTESDARLSTTISIPNPGPGGPIESDITVDNSVSGNMLGVGATAVIGFQDWFAMLDANYAESDLDEFDGRLDIWLMSGRFGRVFNRHKKQWMVWGGFMYIDSERTISISSDLPIIGRTVIEVDQRPTDPLSYQAGGSLTVDTRWNVLTEIGTNFDDAFIVVTSLTYRF